MRKRAEMLIQECKRSSQKSLKSKSKHYYIRHAESMCSHCSLGLFYAKNYLMKMYQGKIKAELKNIGAF